MAWAGRWAACNHRHNDIIIIIMLIHHHHHHHHRHHHDHHQHRFHHHDIKPWSKYVKLAEAVEEGIVGSKRRKTQTWSRSGWMGSSDSSPRNDIMMMGSSDGNTRITVALIARPRNDMRAIVAPIACPRECRIPGQDISDSLQGFIFWRTTTIIMGGGGRCGRFWING